MDSDMITNAKEAIERAKKIRLLLTDSDGVLTDTGVYYGAEGEVMKRFSIRDGMGVERLTKLCGIETGIITGEMSPSLAKRAEKLRITELHLGVKDKLPRLHEILKRKNLKLEEVAYIGDDVNDLEVLEAVGLAACPSDAMHLIRHAIHYPCNTAGGHGCFREFAEFIIHCKQTS
jgi:3-deoxy-D-manno-octulosonate 8-phosphate phosphatase (KDO 8-P phosphatase)